MGPDGHHYHESIIIPGALRLLRLDDQNLKSAPYSRIRVLDAGCGQGILGRSLPDSVDYVGVDLSAALLRRAQSYDKSPNHRYVVADASLPLLAELHSSNDQTNDHPSDQHSSKSRSSKNSRNAGAQESELFTHAAMLLSLQNMRQGNEAVYQVGQVMAGGGRLAIVLNHPCFRVPRQSSWVIDEQKKLQYRRVDRYMTQLDVPIHTHPSLNSANTGPSNQRQQQASSSIPKALLDSDDRATQGDGSDPSGSTVSYHHPLQSYFKWLADAGFVVETVEEWCSNKTSIGAKAKMENRARNEFPLFLAILALKRKSQTRT